MIRAFVFDFDGTLVDSNAIKADGYRRVAAVHPGGAAIMEATIAEVLGDRFAVFEAYAKRLERAGGPICSPSDLAASYTASVDTAVAAAAEMPGARQLLNALREAGCASFLSSATPVASLSRIVAARGWTFFFKSIHGAPAPKLDTLRRIIAVHHLAPGEVAVVGDGADDHAAAAATGCRFFPVGGFAGGLPTYQLPEIEQFALADTREESMNHD